VFAPSLVCGYPYHTRFCAETVGKSAERLPATPPLHKMKDMKRIIYLTLYLSMVLVGVQTTIAQSDATRGYSIREEGVQVTITVPAAWARLPETPSNRLDVRSAPDLFVAGEDLERVVVVLDRYSGITDPNDLMGGYMKSVQATLQADAANHPYPLDHFSEIVRFRWNNREAALFLAYGDGGGGIPAYYGRWIAVEEGNTHVILIEQGAALPQGVPPTSSTLHTWDSMLTSLTINRAMLGFADVERALKRTTDPLSLATSGVVALRGVADVRIAAPLGWQRRDVSETYSAVYLFEDDLREFTMGQAIDGAFAQLTLQPIEGVPDDLQTGGLALAYLNSLLPTVDPTVLIEQPNILEWTDDIVAIWIEAQHPAAIAPHPAGTNQQLWVIELDNEVLTLSFYAPTGRANELLDAWGTILQSIIVNDVPLPREPIDALFNEEPDS